MANDLSAINGGIAQASSTAGYSVRFESYFATSDNLALALGRRPRVLHFCGHGIPGALVLENERGGSVLAEVCGLCAPRGASSRALINFVYGRAQVTALAREFCAFGASTSLVFLAACKSAVAATGTYAVSMSVADALIFAGVKHVVAATRDLDDEHATMFTRTFYLHLLDGRTIFYAFRVACSVLPLKAGSGTGSGLLLLPECVHNHDDPLIRCPHNVRRDALAPYRVRL